MNGVFQQLALAGLINFIPRSPVSPNTGFGLPAVVLNSSAAFYMGASYNFDHTYYFRVPYMGGYKKGNNALWFHGCNLPGTGTENSWNNVCVVFIPNDLKAIDQKIDDGYPLSGNLFGFGCSNDGSAFTNTHCIVGLYNPVPAKGAYDLSYTTAQCHAALVID